jgi:ankyrin repeat protein
VRGDITIVTNRWVRCPRTPIVVVGAIVWLASGISGDSLGQQVAAAAKADDRKALAALIKQGADVNVPQSDGATALHWAAHWDDGEAADLLLRAHARVDVSNEYGATPLSLAALNGSPTMIARLLKARADPNGRLQSGETVLMTAARTGNADAVKLLVAAGAKVDAQESTYGQTALMWAAAERHRDAILALLAGGAHVNATSRNGYSAILFGARTGDVDIVRVLLDGGASIEQAAADGVTPLLMATVHNKLSVARLLLERGARADSGTAGFTPLHWASGIWESLTTLDFHDEEWALEGLPQREKTEFIRLLLQRGADVNAQMTKPPPRFGGRSSRVLGPVSEVGATPFWIAAASGDLDTMKLLVASGANPALSAKDGTTALMAASGMMHLAGETRIPEARYVEVAKFLIDLGADLKAANAGGNTALHATAFSGFDAIAKLLVEHGAPLSPKNKQGWTPLHIADGIVLAMQVHAQESTARLLKQLGATE